MTERFSEGHLSYIQIPATDARESARFYEAVFGWEIHDATKEHAGFADVTGGIGAFVTNKQVSREPGVLPYISVSDVGAMLEKVTANGGDVVREPHLEGDLTVATFRDPAGNVIGIWTIGG